MKRSSTKHSSGFYEDMKQSSNATSTNGESSTSDDSFKGCNGSGSARPRNSPPPLIPAIRSDSEVITIESDSEDDQLNNNIRHEDEENDVSFDYNDYQNNNESSSPDRHLATGRGESNGSGGNRDSAGSSVVFVEDAANLELEQLSKINTAVVLDPSEKVASVNFEFLKLLGTGAYGRVYLVKKIDGVDKGAFYAMKVLEKEKVTKKNKTTEHTRTEREVLERIIDCPFLATLNYAFQTPAKLYLVLDFVQGGELFSHLYKSECFSEVQVRFYIAEIIVALEQLHAINIIYRDIKLENILLDKDGHIVIVDFGLSKELKNGARAHSYCGTIEYMAPEIVSQNKEGHDLNVDWWSVGVLIIELLTGQSPFSRENEESHQGRISERIRNQPPTIPDTIKEDARDLILKLLEKNPTKRLGFKEDAEELKRHKFFKKINWKKLKEKASKAPMVPKVDGEDDVRQFSEDFTKETITPEDDGVPLPHANAANLFRGYSFVAPHLRRPRPAAEPQPEPLSRPSLHSVLKAQKWAKSKFFSKYEIEEDEEPIGDGTYSICMRCTAKETGVAYAVKIMNKLHDPSQELEALRQCGDHPNIVKLIEDLEDSSFRYIVFELLSGGELFSRIREQNHFSEDTARVFFKQLVDAVKFMHDRGIVHRDLKPENIMFISEDEQSQLKIVDFGFARKKTSEETSPCFTLDYAAPESLSKGTTKESRDMWSLGVILYTMLVGHTPFMPQNINKQTDEMKYRKQLTENISKGLYNQKSENFRNVSEEARSLISSLLEVDEADRCILDEILKHPWLTGADFEENQASKADSGFKSGAEEPITIDDDSTDDSSGIVLSERNEGSSTSSHELIAKADSTDDQPRAQLPAAEIKGEVEPFEAGEVQEKDIPVEEMQEVKENIKEVESKMPEEEKLQEIEENLQEVTVTKVKASKEKMKPKKIQYEVEENAVDHEKEELELPEPLLEMPSLVSFEEIKEARETEQIAMPTLVENRSEDFPGFELGEIDDVGAWKLFFYQFIYKVPIRPFVKQIPPKRGREMPQRRFQLVVNPVNQENSRLRSAAKQTNADESRVLVEPPVVEVRKTNFIELENYKNIPIVPFKQEGQKATRNGRRPKLQQDEQLLINPVHPDNLVEPTKKRKHTRRIGAEFEKLPKQSKLEPIEQPAIVFDQGPRYPSRKRAHEVDSPEEAAEEPVAKKKPGRKPGKLNKALPELVETNASHQIIVETADSQQFIIQEVKPRKKPGRRPKIPKEEPVFKNAITIIAVEEIPALTIREVKAEPIRTQVNKGGRPRKQPADAQIPVKKKPGRPKNEAQSAVAVKKKPGRPKKDATIQKHQVTRRVTPSNVEIYTYLPPSPNHRPTFLEYSQNFYKNYL